MTFDLPNFSPATICQAQGKKTVIFLGGASCGQQKPRERSSWVFSTQQVTQGHFD